MRNETLESLPNTTSNEFMSIYRQATNMEEFYMANYLRALQDDVFNLYRALPAPFTPTGWNDAYQEYLEIDNPEIKAKIWKKIKDSFSGYLKARDTFTFENASNKYFLIQMKEFFQEKNMLPQVYKVRERLKEFGFYEKD